MNMADTEQGKGQTMITIRNRFHNTSVTVRANLGDILTDGQMRRIRRELCGISDCRCGTIRGHQETLGGTPFSVEEIDQGVFQIYDRNAVNRMREEPHGAERAKNDRGPLHDRPS